MAVKERSAVEGGAVYAKDGAVGAEDAGHGGEDGDETVVAQAGFGEDVRAGMGEDERLGEESHGRR